MCVYVYIVKYSSKFVWCRMPKEMFPTFMIFRSRKLQFYLILIVVLIIYFILTDTWKWYNNDLLKKPLCSINKVYVIFIVYIYKEVSLIPEHVTLNLEVEGGCCKLCYPGMHTSECTLESCLLYTWRTKIDVPLDCLVNKSVILFHFFRYLHVYIAQFPINHTHFTNLPM